MAVPPDIQRLVHVVPRPPGEPIAPGATDDDIRGFERRTGVALPAEFRDWLRFTNAPVIGPGGFYGVGKADAIEDIELVYGLEPAWRAAHWVPVAGDGCGDVYLIAPLRRFGLDHPVCFWDHETDDPLVPGYVVASDLWHFVRFLLRSELGEGSWPFDREKVLAEDPALAKVTGIDLPWQTGA